jgi:hypothetical protein
MSIDELREMNGVRKSHPVELHVDFNATISPDCDVNQRSRLHHHESSVCLPIQV